jgi:hypothetical protein
MDGKSPYGPQRRRLLNCHPAETQDFAVKGVHLTATIGFDSGGRPAEVFLTGAKDGSTMAAFLDDASIVSVALQHGVPAADLAKSVSPLPMTALASPYSTSPQSQHHPHRSQPYRGPAVIATAGLWISQ